MKLKQWYEDERVISLSEGDVYVQNQEEEWKQIDIGKNVECIMLLCCFQTENYMDGETFICFHFKLKYLLKTLNVYNSLL